MAYPTAVNPKVTDAITEVNTLVVGLAPGESLGLLYQATAQALANAANNATTVQKQTDLLFTAVTSVGIAIVESQKPKAT
ncbi:MAG: RebB family R body protein [Acidobacteriota bacterium]